MTEGGGSAGLATRPTATTYDLEDLVSQAWSGYIRVPHFQRDFRWTRDDVLDLFDSIYKGYPIGSFLLWIRPAPAQTFKLGALTIPAPKAEKALWVVDGQQRITSLANALHESGAADPRFALAFDLRNKRFTTSVAQEDPWVIPLPVVFDLQRLIRWFAAHPEIYDHLDQASLVTKTIRQFKIPAYLVEQENEGTLRDIFDRMNNSGKRLKRAEVFSALHKGDETSDDGVLDINVIAENIDTDRGFGQIDADTVLRAILARRGPNVMRDIRTEFSDADRQGIINFPDESRDAAYKAGEEALRCAVAFLQDQAGVPHFTMLPYRYLLIVLSRVFAHYPDADRRNLLLLRRWFWRAAVLGPGAFRGNVTGAARQLNGKVRPGDLSGSVQELLATLDERGRVPLPNLGRFKTNEAAAKIILCSWWSAELRSPSTGERFNRAQLAELLADQPTAAVATPYIIAPQQAVPIRYRMWAANRVLIPSEREATSEIVRSFAQQPLDLDAGRWTAMLDSHGITLMTASLLAGGQVEAFLKARQETLSDRLQNFLERMCEWDFENTPPLEDLEIEDLDESPDGDGPL